jgi:hypothetical protein
LSIDPVVTDANKGSNFNRYAYAKNSPYKYVDPDGRNAMIACVAGPVPCLVGAAITAVAAVAIVVKGQDVIHSVAKTEPKKQESSSSDSTKAETKNVGISSTLPKPPTGAGSVPKADRDPKRYFTPGERDAKREEQGHKCGAGCGTDIDKSNSAGHHIDRHADGGRTVPEYHAEVCNDCHAELHDGK